MKEKPLNETLTAAFLKLKSYCVGGGEKIKNVKAFKEVLGGLSEAEQKEILEHRDSVDGNTLINASVMWDATKTAKYLIELGTKVGADINIANNDGNTAAHPAIYLDNLEIFEALKEAQANFLIKNNAGKIPLELCEKNSRIDQYLDQERSRERSYSSYTLEEDLDLPPGRPAQFSGASHAVVRNLREENQHDISPRGVRSFLFDEYEDDLPSRTRGGSLTGFDSFSSSNRENSSFGDYNEDDLPSRMRGGSLSGFDSFSSSNRENYSANSHNTYAAPSSVSGGGVHAMTGGSESYSIEFEKRPTKDKNIHEFHPKEEDKKKSGEGYVKETWKDGGYVYQPIPGKNDFEGKTYTIKIPCERKEDGTFSKECETLTFNREGKLTDYQTELPGKSQLNQEEFRKQLDEKEKSRRAPSLRQTLSRTSTQDVDINPIGANSTRRSLNLNGGATPLIQEAERVASQSAQHNTGKSKTQVRVL